MEQFTFSAPDLLLSVVSLLLLAYAIWFLAEVQVVRSLNITLKENPNSLLLGQIKNLKKHLRLTLSMQILGFSCLLLCVVLVYFIFMYLYVLAEILFGTAFGPDLFHGSLHP